MTTPNLLIYFEWVDLFKQMPAEDVKTILLALLEFMDSGEVPAVEFENPLVHAIFQMMLQKTKDNREAYYEKCAKNRENAKLGGAPKGNKNAAKTTQNNRTVEKTTQNNPIEGNGKEGNGKEGNGKECEGKGKEGSSHTPTLSEVKDFCSAEGLAAIDPERFWNYYQSQGWLVDGKPMDWQARARLWNSQDAEKKTPKTTEFQNFHQRKYDFAALEEELLKK